MYIYNIERESERGRERQRERTFFYVRLTAFYENFLSSKKVVVLSLVVGRKFP